MKDRLLTSLGLGIVFILIFVLKQYVSAYFFDAFIALIMVVASYEFSKILTKMGKFNHSEMIMMFPIVLAVGLVVSLFLGAGYYSLLIGLGFVACFTLGVFLVDLIFVKQTKKEMAIREFDGSLVKFAFKKALNTMYGYLYPAFVLSCMILLNHFEVLSSVGEQFADVSFFVLLFAFLIPIFTDSFAMLIGSLIEGKKLCPKISPSKTISGAIGGALSCVVLCATLFLLFNQIESISLLLNSVNLGINSIWKLVLIVFFGSIVSQFGDIFESYLKRRAKVKDSGRILPGHGGILDRFDSYIFVAPYILLAFLFLFI